ncbi:hypothetical protein MKX01_026908 [Papaver californicum]|nr:hypothetical protein MKX01_026908 [Papaver californicum]
MEGSLVVFPLAAASMYNSESGSDGGAHLLSSGGIFGYHLQANNSGFHSSIIVLKCAFDIVTSQTQVLYDKLYKEVDNRKRC